MKRWRKETRPRNPTTFEEYAEQLLRVDAQYPRVIGTVLTPAGKAIILGMEACGEVLRAAERFVVDGTFKTVPSQFPATQLLTVHVIHQGHFYHPIVALMNNRSQILYEQVFQLIARVAGPLRPLDIITDYEPALQGALSDTFGVPVHGCLFHYLQALQRKARSLGVGTRRNNPGAAMVHLYGALAYLPAAQIAAGLIEVHNVCLERGIPRAIDFNAYYQAQWMQRVGPEVFSVHNRIHRTSNVAESFHAGLSRGLRPHPNIWQFTECIFRKFCVSHSQYAAAIAGSVRRRNVVVNPRWRLINGQLAAFDRGELTLRELLLSIYTGGLIHVPAMEDEEVPFVGEEVEIDDRIEAASPPPPAALCAICRDNVPTLVLVPCGHVVCDACWGQLTSCPFCRAEVTVTQRFYLT